MASLKDLETALVNADKAGDEDAARRLAVAVRDARANQSGADLIPGAGPAAKPAPAEGLLQQAGKQVVGVGEMALTGITAPFAYLHGLARGGDKLVQKLLYEATGTPGGDQVQDPGQAFEQGSSALQYVPRTDEGKAQTEALANLAAPLPGLGAELGTVAQAIRLGRAGATLPTTARAVAEGAARDVAGPGAAAVVAKAADATAQLPATLKSAYDATVARIGKGFGMSEPTSAAEGGSVGAAGVERAKRLDTTAAGLRVPVNLTRGEATGDAAQIRFEQEQAKSALGAPLRDRSAQTNRALGQNIETLIDETGAETGSHIEAGRTLASTIAKGKARATAAERAAWTRADESGATSDLVDLQPVADYLNQNRAGRSAAPIMEVLERELGVQGVGAGSLADGTLTIGPTTLKQAEGLRKSINRFVKDDGNDQRVAGDIKRAIDGQTDTLGNDLYKEARRATQRKEQLYGENAVVSQLIKLRKGTKDRQVALEDVYRKTIREGDREDLSMLRRTLDVADQHQGIKPGTTGDGAQAWRELQGATLRDALDEATKGFAVAQDGVQRFSGAQFSKWLRDMERGGKLEFVFGKQRAQLLRDVAEVAKTVQAFPAGAVNSSNTASVILQAIGEAGLTGSLTGLPVPAVSLIRAGSQAIKDAKTRKRISEALRGIDTK